MSVPTYLSLTHWTDRVIKNYKDSLSRAADFTATLLRVGFLGNIRSNTMRVFSADEPDAAPVMVEH
jgi:uncharacterized protein with GYD domain